MEAKEFEKKVKALCDDRGVMLTCMYEKGTEVHYEFGFVPDKDRPNIGYLVTCSTRVIDGNISFPEAVYLAGKLAGISEYYDAELESVALYHFSPEKSITMAEALEASEQIQAILIPFAIDLLRLVRDLSVDLVGSSPSKKR